MRCAVLLIICYLSLISTGCEEDPASASSSDTGYVYISSVPPNATVTVDGDTIGIANTSQLSVPTGTHNLCLYLDSCDTCFSKEFSAGSNPGFFVTIPCSVEALPDFDSLIAGSWYTFHTFRYGSNNSGFVWDRQYTVDSTPEIIVFTQDSLVDAIRDDSLACYLLDTLTYDIDEDTICWHFPSGTYRNAYEVTGDTLRLFIGEYSSGQIVNEMKRVQALPDFALCE